MFFHRYLYTVQIHDERPKCVSGDDCRMFYLSYSEPYAGFALRKHTSVTLLELLMSNSLVSFCSVGIHKSATCEAFYWFYQAG